MAAVRQVYALFDDSDAADAAYREVQERGCESENCTLLMQRDILDEEQLMMGQTAAREGAKKGALAMGTAGAVLGGVAGLAAGPAELLGWGPLIGLAFGTVVGAAYGALVGTISGAAEPGKELRKIEAEVNAGKILIAVETKDPALEQTCAEVFALHGGRPVE